MDGEGWGVGGVGGGGASAFGQSGLEVEGLEATSLGRLFQLIMDCLFCIACSASGHGVRERMCVSGEGSSAYALRRWSIPDVDGDRIKSIKKNFNHPTRSNFVDHGRYLVLMVTIRPWSISDGDGDQSMVNT